MAWMSMTGYGRAERHGDDVSVSVEIRSVNHRFLDAHVRLPGRYMSWEPRVRAMVRDTLRRGKVDLHINIRESGRYGAKLSVNRELLRAFLDEAGGIRREFGVGGDVTLRDLLSVPELLQVAPEGEGTAEALWPEAEAAVRDALAMLSRARREEGERLERVLVETAGRIGAIVAEIRSLSSENRELAQARFRERIEALQGSAGIDPVRLHQEAAILVDRLDITEECDRLESHLAAMDALFRDPGEAVGKRFDFLLQEAFRELNTAGNKSAHAGVSQRVVTAKAELEKIREQIQNVE